MHRGFDGLLLLGVLPLAQSSSGHPSLVQRLGLPSPWTPAPGPGFDPSECQRSHCSSLLACRGFDGQLLLGILPVSQFSSGHTYFVQRLGERLGLPQYAVHATFQFSGTPGKRNRMRERLLWSAVSPPVISQGILQNPVNSGPVLLSGQAAVRGDVCTVLSSAAAFA